MTQYSVRFVMFSISLFLFGGLFLVGCGSTVSKSNYDKIESGMTIEEVENILGKGEEQASSSINIPGQSISIPGGGNVSTAGMSTSAKAMVWKDGTKVISIMFSDGKVMGKSQLGL